MSSNEHPLSVPANNHGPVSIQCATYAELIALTGRYVGTVSPTLRTFTADDVSAGLIAAVGTGVDTVCFVLTGYNPILWTPLGGLVRACADSAVATPPAGFVSSLYYSTDQEALAFKDSTPLVHVLAEVS